MSQTSANVTWIKLRKTYLKVCKPQWVDCQLNTILCQDKDVNISNVIII